MAEKTEISWTDATFNPWMGCTKVGPGCDHCYAEALMDTRYGKVVWGVGGERVRTGVKNWNLPKRWNDRGFYECRICHSRTEGVDGVDRDGAATWKCSVCRSENIHAVRRRVFCSSLADVFDNAVDPAWRADLFQLIRATPNLDWLLLTKRIGNAHKMIDEALIGSSDLLRSWPWPNVWLGATVVNQEEADRDVPKLLATPAAVRFLSMEPLLGPVDLRQAHMAPKKLPRVDWVIVGGESGKGARAMPTAAVRSLRDQCAATGVPFHFKQWGEWGAPGISFPDGHPELAEEDEAARFLVGKKAAGRELDGRTHNEFPKVVPA